MYNKIILATDGTDYAGKSEFCEKMARLFRSLGMRVAIIGQPRKDTVYGRLSRQLIAEQAPVEAVVDALTTDLLDTLDSIPAMDVDVVILDRHICSTITYQGEVGKCAVMQNQRLLRHTSGPEMYIQMTCPYDVMVERRKARAVQEGKTWDDALTSQFVGSREAWDELVDRVKFAHQIVVGSGVCAVHEIVPCQGPEQDLKALDIVQQAMNVWIKRNQREEERRRDHSLNAIIPGYLRDVAKAIAEA